MRQYKRIIARHESLLRDPENGFRPSIYYKLTVIVGSRVKIEWIISNTKSLYNSSKGDLLEARKRRRDNKRTLTYSQAWTQMWWMILSTTRSFSGVNVDTLYDGEVDHYSIFNILMVILYVVVSLNCHMWSSFTSPFGKAVILQSRHLCSLPLWKV